MAENKSVKNAAQETHAVRSGKRLGKNLTNTSKIQARNLWREKRYGKFLHLRKEQKVLERISF